jgi:hypothetical protein
VLYDKASSHGIPSYISLAVYARFDMSRMRMGANGFAGRDSVRSSFDLRMDVDEDTDNLTETRC